MNIFVPLPSEKEIKQIGLNTYSHVFKRVYVKLNYPYL